MKFFGRCIGMLAFFVAVYGLTILSSTGDIYAGECQKEIKIVEVELTGDGPQVSMECGVDGEEQTTYDTCYEFYWVVPAHAICVDSDEVDGHCCHFTKKKATYHKGNCVGSFTCTYTVLEQDIDDDVVVPSYFEAKLLECTDGEPNADCGGIGDSDD
ncbi:MAG: hypothetical protein L3J82_02135 [Planctomycetes bacterium]|nr:hypothetical protein [Planctomycetota bacterium]